MKYILTAAMIVAAGAAFAGSHDDRPDKPGLDPGGTSLGDVTRDSIEQNGGRAQGEHASTSDATEGPGRAGLANVVERGNLGATIEAVDCDGVDDIPGACGD